MSKFIEVTKASDKSKHLINLDWIEEICKDAGGMTMIYFAASCQGALFQDYMRVLESYDEIKRKVGAANG